MNTSLTPFTVVIASGSYLKEEEGQQIYFMSCTGILTIPNHSSTNSAYPQPPSTGRHQDRKIVLQH